MTMASTVARVRVLVWDLPTRLFHWTLVALVGLAWPTGETEGFWFTVHEFAGYGVLALLVFRVLWGVWGSRHSLFADFVRPLRVVRDYSLKLLTLRPPHVIGHNPLGGWMIVLLLVVLSLLVATGLFASHEHDGAVAMAGPLAHHLSTGTPEAIAEAHEALFDVLLVLVAIHVTGVLVDILLTRENLIRSMVTGVKSLFPQEAAGETGQPAPAWRAVVAILVSVAVAWLVVGYY